MRHLVTASAVLGRTDADSVVVDHGVVTAVGRASDLVEDGVLQTPPREGVIMRGLRDGHIHPSGYAAAVTGISLADAADFAEVGERIFEAALQLLPGVPVVANRLDEHRLREGRMPTRHDLDRFLENRPIIVTRYCGHVAMANTSAIRRAGLTSKTPDPPGGSIDRDASGVPTGVLRETAVGLVSGALAADLPSPGPDRLRSALTGLTGHGITRIHAIVSTGAAMWCGSGSELDDLLDVAEDLPLEIGVFVTASTPVELEAAANRVRATGGALTWRGWKSFADGSLGGLTAAMDAPFEDDPSTGTLRLDSQAASTMAEATLDMGGTVAIHAIGDRANRAVLDLFRSLKGGWADPTRMRVEHASVLPPELIEQFASTGVTASVQPAFIGSEVSWLESRVGAERSRWTYPLGSLVEAGVRLIAGSDSPVEDPNPWTAMALACDNPLNPEESIDRETAVTMYGGRTPRVGDVADLVVLDRNPLSTDDLGSTRVLATYKAGVEIDARPMPWPG